jgi:16S rRNA (cytosine967-C5)-methyltransferase
MELPALLGHGAELLRIIRKSAQPADLIASEFFHKKKYIGSTERRFISELVFSTLRIYLLSKKCSDFAIELINPSVLDNEEKNLPEELPVLVTTCIIAENFYNSKPFFQPEEILRKFNKNSVGSFEKQLKKELSDKLSFNEEESNLFFDKVKIKFQEIDNISQRLIKSHSTLTNDELKIISVRYSIPEWILERWIKNENYRISLIEARQLAESLFYPAPLTIRVNLSLISRDEVVQIFEKNNILCTKGKLSASAVILGRRVQLNEYDIYRNGLIEVQDEGSQVISLAISPEPDDRILDACAGAGGKSLHLADLQNNKCEIFSNDIDNRKLRELKSRANRSGFNSIRLLKISSEELLKDKFGSGNKPLFDTVLVDAPCSGTGTVRRSPMLKLRLTPDILEKHSGKQLKLLGYYSQFVREGGTLVYSTCSLMSEENEDVIYKFLSQNPEFEPLSLKTAFALYGANLPELKNEDFNLRLSPSKHGCDGFFIAKLKRL